MSTATHKSGRSHARFTFFVCFMAALAGLLFGLDIGVIAGALPFLSTDLHINNQQQEWVVSSMMFGAVVGALAAVAERGIAHHRPYFLGLAVGIASYTAPLYLSEIAPEKIRGSMISMYQLMITIGILAAYLSDTAFSYSGSWRLMLGIITIPAVLLFIGVLFLPGSPRWLAACGRYHEAQKVLDMLRSSSTGAKRTGRNSRKFKN